MPFSRNSSMVVSLRANIYFALLMSLWLGGCTSPSPKSSVAEHILAPREQAAARSMDSDIPEPVLLSSNLPRPRPSARAETFSVVVNNVSVQELLFALARDAGLNVDIHQGIRGSVTLNAIDQTLPQLLNRIGKQVDLRWELDGPNLVVQPDVPFLKIYRIDYANLERLTTGQIGVATQITTPGGTGSGGGGGSSGSNVSNANIRTTSSNKFWETLLENIRDILRETDKVLPTGIAGTQSPNRANGSTEQTPTPAANILASQPTSNSAAAPTPQPSTTFREAASVISNPESGVMTIRASSRQHERIQEFIDQVVNSARKQVLIEATIMEVELNNNYQQGINWQSLGLGMFQGNSAPNSTTPSGVSSSVFTLSGTSRNLGNLSLVVRLLESFGTVRVLSSPKISVLNNQSAILKVVNNLVYFTIRAETTSTANVATTSYTTTPNIVAVGFVMNVTPQIGDNDTVLLNVKPTISRVSGYVNDPNPVLANPCGTGVANCGVAAIKSAIPQVQTREMESIIKVNSGQIAVMGGLIQDANSDVEDGVPGLNRIPFFGELFTQRNRSRSKTELIIFMRPVVINDPSIDGDFRSMRSLLPNENFLGRGNPGKTSSGMTQ